MYSAPSLPRSFFLRSRYVIVVLFCSWKKGGERERGKEQGGERGGGGRERVGERGRGKRERKKGREEVRKGGREGGREPQKDMKLLCGTKRNASHAIARHRTPSRRTAKHLVAESSTAVCSNSALFTRPLAPSQPVPGLKYTAADAQRPAPYRCPTGTLPAPYRYHPTR
jgi:hypothetical protein